MSLITRLLASTIGRVAPRYRTVNEWAVTYRKIIAAKSIADKTKSNRTSSLAHILANLGERIVSDVKPHEISELILETHANHPQKAKRILIEVRDMFNEAMAYGWIDRNPAISIKAPIVRVRRKRLTLDQWWQILRYAIENMPPWVPRMMALALATGQRRSDLCKMKLSDVWDDHLHVEQAKTGERVAIPLALRLDVIGLTVGQIIEDCLSYSTPGNDRLLIRKNNGKALGVASLSARFEEAREGALGDLGKNPPSLHECRSLSERLYRKQGINTMVLLGHKHQSMTDVYNDDRGLTRGEWKTLSLQ
jgi:integrase